MIVSMARESSADFFLREHVKIMTDMGNYRYKLKLLCNFAFCLDKIAQTDDSRSWFIPDSHPVE